jgi:hypothetical protein
LKYVKTVEGELRYLGLPSAEMLDVKVWRPVLSHITAVEREEVMATQMYRTAQLIGVRHKTMILEQSLADVLKILALEEHDAQLHLANLSRPTRENYQKLRQLPHDIFNLDFFGGFLYPKGSGRSDNLEILRNIITYQARYKHPFFIILTLNFRDTGKDNYKSFIKETLRGLKGFNVNTTELEKYYLNSERQLDRLRFCVPNFINKIAFENFAVKSLGAWTYKSFYHTILFFNPRQGVSLLGSAWPPLEEFKEIMKSPLYQLSVSGKKVKEKEIKAPSI